MDQANERSVAIINIAFTDENGDPVVPSSATYQIDDVGSGTAIRAATAISPLDTDVDIALTSEDLVILDETKPYETRRVTFEWVYNTDTSPSISASGNKEYFLNVANLHAVTTPSPA